MQKGFGYGEVHRNGSIPTGEGTFRIHATISYLHPADALRWSASPDSLWSFSGSSVSRPTAILSHDAQSFRIWRLACRSTSRPIGEQTGLTGTST